MNNLRTTNILLLIIAVPVFFYILKLLSFIFIPLFFSLFIAVLFWPIIRWLQKRKVPKIINLGIVILIMLSFIKLTSVLIQISSSEIINANSDLLEKADIKLDKLILPIEKIFSVQRDEGQSVISQYSNQINVKSLFGDAIISAKNMITMILMTLFFAILLLSESLNLHDILQSILIKKRFSSTKIFLQIEKDIITFVKVKFILSFFTGLGFTLVCYYFDVSFPIFWGLLAFSLNFIQLIGSVISVILLAMFALIEINTTGTLVFFIVAISLVEIIIGALLEPIFMGKSFSINVITILIMLMFWGFLWGVSGMILSIPITVFSKIIFDHFPKTKILSNLMSGNKLQV